MDNPWMGPYRPDCIIGEDPQFIAMHAEKTQGAKLLPVPYGKGFGDHDTLTAGVPEPVYEGWFDEHGRCDPRGLTKPVHLKSRRYFQIEQSSAALRDIYGRITKFLPGHYPEFAEFEARVEALRQGVAGDAATKAALRGVVVPFMLPQCTISDEGAALEEFYLQFAARAFEAHHMGQEFKDHHKQALTGLMRTRTGSRHERLLEALETGPVIGLFLASALSEYSVGAAVERVAALPENWLLAGGVDTAAALIAEPGLLLRRKGYAPMLWTAGLETREGEGHYFEAYGYDMTFNRRMHFGECAETSSCGLVVIEP
jgi:hypothetical protein